MATEYTSYQQTLVTTPTTPSTETVFDMGIMRALIREIWADPIDEPMLNKNLTSAKSFFRGNGVLRVDTLNRYLPYGQNVIIPIFKDQNPFSLFTKSELESDEIDACHDQLNLDCTMPCLNTLPEIEALEVVFDTEYAYGVRACDKNRQFWDYGFFTKQYALSRQGMEFGRELDLWNRVIGDLIASPATTVDALVAAVHPTHYWADLGNFAANRDKVMEAVQYHMSSFEVNDTVFITKEAATAVIQSIQNPYNLNLSQTVVNTFNKWDIPGYSISEAVSNILGAGSVPIVILERSPWMTGATYNRYPLWNEDHSKQYVAILDPRVAYDLEIDGYHLNIMPYDCDKLVRGMIDSIYVAQGITFPQYGMILEFDGPQVGTTPVTGLDFGESATTMTAGETETFELTVTPAGATAPITYTSNNTAVATVTAAAEGTGAAVTAVAEGVAVITASASGVSASIAVTVSGE